MASVKRIAILQDPIAFSDLRERQDAEKKKLEDRKRLLKEMSQKLPDGSVRKRSLTSEEAAELQEIEQKLASDDVVDPLFKAVQQRLKLDVQDHKEGLFPSQRMWETLHELFAPGAGTGGNPIFSSGANPAAVLEIVGLKDFAGVKPLGGTLLALVSGIFADDAARVKLVKVLKDLATLFDEYIASLTDPEKSIDKASFVDKIRKAVTTKGPASDFVQSLADAVEAGFVAPAETLVDLLLAVSEGIKTENRSEWLRALLQRFAPTTGGSHIPGQLTDDEKLLAAVYGILEADREEPPAYHLRVAKRVFDPSEARQGQQFGKALFAAQGEYATNQDLFNAVLPILVKLGEQGPLDEVKAIEWARVVRYLIKRGISEGESQLGRKVDEALNSIQNVGDDLPPSLIGIDLPDLEEEGTTDHEIVEDNIRALQPAYFSAMFEELKVYQVVDKLLELFQNGILPIGKGEPGGAGDSLFKYWKETANRVSEAERRSFYARTLGFVGGDDASMPNREFNDLWMRFVSGVSSFIRQNNVDDLLRTKIPGAISQQQVRKAGRDLAANLSLHGYGMAHFMATELQKQIKDAIKLLSEDDIKNAYGARDMWQVIDQVATLELGGSKNSVRYRTMAASGAIIMAWLAKRSRDLSRTSFGSILDMDEIRNPSPRPNGFKATISPTDFDLVNACEQWLAVTGTQDEQVEDYAQPKEAPNMTSKPIQIPAIAREMLESVGVPAMGLDNGSKRY